MNKLVVIIFLVVLYGSSSFMGFALAIETTEHSKVVKGEIISINEEHSFIIINLGKNNGLAIGSILDIYQDDKRIGKMKVVRVGESVAVTEITAIKQGVAVKVGDKVILLEKKLESILKGKKKQVRKKEGVKEKKETIIIKEVAINKTIKKEPYSKGLGKIALDINADRGVVWLQLIQALRDSGFIITHSHRPTGLISARKNLEFSLAREIWADIRGNTNYEAVLQVTIVAKEKDKTHLTFDVEGSYKRGGEYQQFRIERENKIYQEIEEIIKKVKEGGEQ